MPVGAEDMSFACQEEEGGLQGTMSDAFPEWGCGEPEWLVPESGALGNAVPSRSSNGPASKLDSRGSNGSLDADSSKSKGLLGSSILAGMDLSSCVASPKQQQGQQLYRSSTGGTSSSTCSAGTTTSSLGLSSSTGLSHGGLANLARQEEMLRWGSAAVDSSSAGASARSSGPLPSGWLLDGAAAAPSGPLTLLEEVPALRSSCTARPPQVPGLDLSKLKQGNSPGLYSRNLSPRAAAQPPERPEAAMCLDTGPLAPLAAGAPVSDSRCYVYGAVNSRDLATFMALLARQTPADAVALRALWDALLVARRDAEAVAARGARVVRDVSRDWQDTVTDLIDRIVAQDQEIAGLKAQVPPTKPVLDSSVEELTAQVLRLKKQRDKSTKEAQEAKVAAEAARAQAEAARNTAAAVQEELLKLRQKHAALQQQHEVGSRYAKQLHAYATGLEHQLSAALAAAGPPTTGAFGSGAASTSSGTAAGTGLGLASERLTAASVAAAAAAALSGVSSHTGYHHHHLVGLPSHHKGSPRAHSPRGGAGSRSSPRAAAGYTLTGPGGPGAAVSRWAVGSTRDRSSRSESGRPDTPSRGDKTNAAGHAPQWSNTYEFDQLDHTDQEPGPGAAPVLSGAQKLARMMQQRPPTPDFLAAPSSGMVVPVEPAAPA